MAYDSYLAERIRHHLETRKILYGEIRMMGGLCFMVDEKMCMGVLQDRLMARIGEDAAAQALERPGCSEVRFNRGPMKGYVFVEAEQTDLETDLEYWVGQCLEFNPKAKRSKKRGQTSS